MKFNGIFYLVLTSICLVALALMAYFNLPFHLLFYLTLAGQALLIFSVYKVLTDNYKPQGTFDDWYEEHHASRER